MTPRDRRKANAAARAARRRVNASHTSPSRMQPTARAVLDGAWLDFRRIGGKAREEWDEFLIGFLDGARLEGISADACAAAREAASDYFREKTAS